jgi:hypothetical protein
MCAVKPTGPGFNCYSAVKSGERFIPAAPSGCFFVVFWYGSGWGITFNTRQPALYRTYRDQLKSIPAQPSARDSYKRFILLGLPFPRGDASVF